MVAARVLHWNWWQTVAWVQHRSTEGLDRLRGLDLLQKSLFKLDRFFPVWTQVEVEILSFGAAKSLSAYGLIQPDNHRVAIADIDWIGGDLSIDYEASLRNGDRLWNQLVFNVADVKTCWPVGPIVSGHIAMPAMPGMGRGPASDVAEQSLMPEPTDAAPEVINPRNESFREWTRRRFDEGDTQAEAFRALQEVQKSGRFPNASREQLRALFGEFNPGRKPGRRPKHAAADD